VLVQGVDVNTLAERELVQLRRRTGMIFQHFNLLSSKTVWQNVALPLQVAGLAPHEVAKRVAHLLDLVGLGDKKDVYPGKLSGGQKQRVGIARALVHRPRDPAVRRGDLRARPRDHAVDPGAVARHQPPLGLTVVLITHDMAVIREVCDRVLVLDGGRLVELGEVWRVFGKPQAEATRALLQPLLHDLPADLAAALVADEAGLQGRPGKVVLSLGFDGASRPQGVPFEALAALGPGTTWLHGGLDRIRGHAQGRLLVAVPAVEGRWFDKEAARLALAADRIEVLGYVHTAD
jgi:D-methionine transport system ATP-binding protein